MNEHSAGQSEIIRSSQKDSFYVQQVGSDIKKCLQSLLGINFISIYKTEIESIIEFVYYLFTTGFGNQTLGEEYVNIIQTNRGQLKIPGQIQRLLMICNGAFGVLAVKRLYRIILQKLTDLNHVKGNLLSDLISNNFSELFQVSVDCHLLLFYFGGLYLHFSKRLTGITHSSIRPWILKNYSHGYKILGLITMIRMVMKILRFSNSTKFSMQGNSESTTTGAVETISGHKCSLCLDHLQSPSLTPCGHLFCWNCIIEWTSKNLFCPICRNHVDPAQVVFLQNY